MEGPIRGKTDGYKSTTRLEKAGGASMARVRSLNGHLGRRLLLCLVLLAIFSPLEQSSAHKLAQGRSSDSSLGKKDNNRPQKYRWLFSPRSEPQQREDAKSPLLFNVFEKRLKKARDLYFTDSLDVAIRELRKAIDEFEQIIDKLPRSHPALIDALDRMDIFEEFAVKMLGPVEYDVKPRLSEKIFDLMEEKRACLRLITLKMAGVDEAFDAPSDTIDQEDQLLENYVGLTRAPNAPKRRVRIIKKLQSIRSNLAKKSPRWALFHSLSTGKLSHVRQNVLKDNELIVDINLFRDRALIGFISTDKCSYFQAGIKRIDIMDAVFDLQDELKQASSLEGHSLMGHEWKESSRRIYRALFSSAPRLREKWTRLFVLPDKALWRLPFTILLDPEDKPLGSNRLISLVPSAYALDFLRSGAFVENPPVKGAPIMAFESMPWIPREQLMREHSQKKERRRHEADRLKILPLILKNPIYPKPSEFLKRVDSIAPRSALWVGPAATLGNWLRQDRDGRVFTLLAVPTPIPDSLVHGRQPTLIFSPDKVRTREIEAKDLFRKKSPVGLMALPNAWMEINDEGSELWGQGPLLFSLAAMYTGVRSYMINYSLGGWGEDHPYIMKLIKVIDKGAGPGKALQGIKRTIPGAMSPTFGAAPPDWAGWILAGDPEH